MQKYLHITRGSLVLFAPDLLKDDYSVLIWITQTATTPNYRYLLSLSNLKSSDVDKKILKLQTDIELTYRAHVQFWNTLREKVPQD